MGQPVDLDHLNEISDNDLDFRSQLVEVYLADTARLINELEQAILEADITKVAVTAHSIKGASSNIGAVAVQEAAFSLEMLGRESSERGGSTSTTELSEIREGLSGIRQAFERVEEYLGKLNG